MINLILKSVALYLQIYYFLSYQQKNYANNSYFIASNRTSREEWEH